MLAPHVSPDDALLSRLTRAGIRATWQQLEQLAGRRASTGAPAACSSGGADGDDRLPAGWSADGPERVVARDRRRSCAPRACRPVPPRSGTRAPAGCGRRGWSRPGWRSPAFACGRRCRVARIERDADAGTRWTLRDARRPVAGRGRPRRDRRRLRKPRARARACRCSRCAARSNGAACPTVPQLPDCRVNGDGHLIADVPDADGALWLTGATFDRDSSDVAPRAADTDVQSRAAGAAASRRARHWLDARSRAASHGPGPACAAPRPTAGRWSARCRRGQPTALWLCTALGSRGLSFAALCAELLAAQLARRAPAAAREAGAGAGHAARLARGLTASVGSHVPRRQPQCAPCPSTTTSPTPPSTATRRRSPSACTA